MARKKSRLYTRQQGGELRYYADFRDLGGSREALKPEGETRATTDPVVAEALVGRRLAELQEQRRDGVLLGVKHRMTLAGYASEHLIKKAKGGRVTDEHILLSELHLREAVSFFGADCELHRLSVTEVQAFVAHLARLPNRRGGTLGFATQRKYLNSLSNLFRRAGGEGIVPPGYNPVAGMMEKPTGQAGEAAWLEVWEAALLLESARTYTPPAIATNTAGHRLGAAIEAVLGTGDAAEAEFIRRMREAGKLATRASLHTYLRNRKRPPRDYFVTAARVLGCPEEEIAGVGATGSFQLVPFAYPLLAAFLLTGGRESEVEGLELGDVNFPRKTITFRINKRRRLKTRTSYRTVPYWPQLQEILEPHIKERRRAGAKETDLLFPSPVTGGMLRNIRKMLDAIAEHAGWSAGQIRTKAFRHTYCAARLQTLDRGAPVSVFTVAREMGHGGDSLVKRIYGHLGASPHRSEEMEYRIEQQRDSIPPERLRLLLRAV